MKTVLLVIFLIVITCCPVFADWGMWQWNFSWAPLIQVSTSTGSDGYEVAGGAYYLLADGSYYINAP